jgi:hypothetical protein
MRRASRSGAKRFFDQTTELRVCTNVGACGFDGARGFRRFETELPQCLICERSRVFEYWRFAYVRWLRTLLWRCPAMLCDRVSSSISY